LVVELLNYAVTGELDAPKVLDRERVRATLAGEVDAEIAEMHAKMHRTRLRNLRGLVEAVASRGPLRDCLDVETATATVWML
jgi:hypothetical protein